MRKIKLSGSKIRHLGCMVDGDAAELADSLDDGTYSDWFLPSGGELNRMRSKIGQAAPAPNTNIGGFASSGYWSSTEVSGVDARGQHFGNGSQAKFDKDDTGLVRAVRAF